MITSAVSRLLALSEGTDWNESKLKATVKLIKKTTKNVNWVKLQNIKMAKKSFTCSAFIKYDETK